MEWWSEGVAYFDNLVTARWDNVPPGTCCTPSLHQLPTLLTHRASETRFFGLLHNQFGAGWAATGPFHSNIINCTGAPILRVFGPSPNVGEAIVSYNPPWGDMDVVGGPGNVVYAASWVDLRVLFPPGVTGREYLAWQGVRRTVWGRGTWTAGSDGLPFPPFKRRGKRRGRAVVDKTGGWDEDDASQNAGARKREEVEGGGKDVGMIREGANLNGYADVGRGNGTAFVQVPGGRMWAEPSMWKVNGTEYFQVGGKGGEYRSREGRVLEW
ncbi:MAG: hypothetical protein Q9219_006911 [cf. Caloplaca sp. 3 TL-2023]